MGIIVDIPFRF